MEVARLPATNRATPVSTTSRSAYVMHHGARPRQARDRVDHERGQGVDDEREQPGQEEDQQDVAEVEEPVADLADEQDRGQQRADDQQRIQPPPLAIGQLRHGRSLRRAIAPRRSSPPARSTGCVSARPDPAPVTHREHFALEGTAPDVDRTRPARPTVTASERIGLELRYPTAGPTSTLTRSPTVIDGVRGRVADADSPSTPIRSPTVIDGVPRSAWPNGPGPTFDPDSFTAGDRGLGRTARTKSQVSVGCLTHRCAAPA